MNKHLKTFEEYTQSINEPSTTAEIVYSVIRLRQSDALKVMELLKAKGIPYLHNQLPKEATEDMFNNDNGDNTMIDQINGRFGNKMPNDGIRYGMGATSNGIMNSIQNVSSNPTSGTPVR